MGSLKSIIRYTAHFKLIKFSDAPEKDGEYKSAFTLFDTRGNIQEEVKYSQAGEVEEHIVNVYDANNKLIEESIYYIPENVSEKRVIRRNEKGVALEEEKKYADGSADLTIYEIDGNDNISQVTKYNEDKTVETKVFLVYDDYHRVIEEKKLDGENQVLEHRKQSYDEKGNLTEVTEYSPEENVAYRTVHDYSEAGKNLSSSYYDAMYKLVVKTTSIFDEKGNLIEKYIEDFGSSMSKKTMTFAYDENNNCIEEAAYAANGSLLRRLSTQFDAIGNPVEEINYEVDLTHGGRDEYFGNRYEYEFYE